MKAFGIAVSVSVLATTAWAAPAVITTAVNFRAGPGTGYQSFGTIPEESQVDVGDCDASGAWCAVKFSGQEGFVNGKYISRTEAEKPSWPRSFTTGNGAMLTLFQPQITDWKDFTQLDALIAWIKAQAGFAPRVMLPYSWGDHAPGNYVRISLPAGAESGSEFD